MSRPYIKKQLKELVIKRANYLCEYCLISDKDSGSFQLDHIISIKHGGETTAKNLAYACLYCNLNKGTDLGSINVKTGELVRFFNPRRDEWLEHFCIQGAIIKSLTDIGEVTSRIFKFNTQDRVLERELLIDVNRYSNKE